MFTLSNQPKPDKEPSVYNG